MNATTKTNHFTRLLAIDVSDLKEKKGKFDYLSWPLAVRELSKIYPDATWEIHEFDGLPYLQTPLGYFVKVSVTVAGITRPQWHPVLDHVNKPLDKPTSFHINTSIQRCLAKAIALQGLGLSLYTGEDLPPENGNTSPIIPPKKPIPPPLPEYTTSNLATAKDKEPLLLRIKEGELSKEDMRTLMKENGLGTKNFNTLTKKDVEKLIELVDETQLLKSQVKKGENKDE